MAVAGLQNVSAFGPNFFGESRPASSVLRMWRELENDHMNHHRRSRQERSGSGSECSSTMTSVGQGSENGDDISEDSDIIENQGVAEMEHEDSNSVISEQSSDLGESERERVRQIFREWMNSGGNAHSSNRFGPGPEWLGEKECGRVRIIREWVQMSTEQRNNFGSHVDGVAEVDSQIEQVRDGLVINHPEIGRRRPIRRLCGRQTLLDLLTRAQTERKKDLEDLSQRKAVSDFAHRNRIQVKLLS